MNPTVDQHALQLGIEFGGGGALGAVVGFATKKLLKVLAVLAGALLMALGVLEREGLVIVRWGALRELIMETRIGPLLPELALDVIGALPVGGGFALGAMVGFKKG